MNILKGRLEAFSDQGTEGIHWSFMDDAKSGLEALTCLSAGDHLTIYNPDALDEVVWSGNINFEYNSHIHGSYQRVNGGTVNGLQSGVSSDEWSLWFHNGYPAEFLRFEIDNIQFYGIRGSSMLHSYAHSKEDLFLQFTNGDIYEYPNIDSDLVDGLYKAESKGKYFISNIKNLPGARKLIQVTRNDIPDPTPFPFPLEKPKEGIPWTEYEEEEFRAMDRMG
jgi:hypothetical protein